MAATGYGHYPAAVTPLRRHLLLLGATVFALGACGGSDGGSASTDSTTSGSATVVSVLDFAAPLVGGGTFEGADLAGRPVALWFWAPT